MSNKARSTYRYLHTTATPQPGLAGEPAGNGLQTIDVGTPTLGIKSIGERARDYLTENERSLDGIGLAEVIRLLLGEAERKRVQDMCEDMLKKPRLPKTRQQRHKIERRCAA